MEFDCFMNDWNILRDRNTRDGVNSTRSLDFSVLANPDRSGYNIPLIFISLVH